MNGCVDRRDHDLYSCITEYNVLGIRTKPCMGSMQELWELVSLDFQFLTFQCIFGLNFLLCKPQLFSAGEIGQPTNVVQLNATSNTVTIGFRVSIR